ncbi:class II aldolase/adducin family protein [Hwanghaeella grinnelliae]|uniref:Class II aldolase/adducin family protein n=1 Tax=Hwanghaeella grinnelliae TaxID=2500179 RepID=A0A3S2WTX4_9PROT|nr:class II aldolase/adducin family protein [Hwanghaeella grinnelliae]RVU38385.1 class II aldolase/adducin family protein [Hwanghaeella grinnelliae]
MSNETEIREALVDYSRKAVQIGLSGGTAGNMSMRFGDRMLITPSGIAPDIMQPDQIAEVEFDGQYKGDWKPSSEWALHAELYALRPEAKAIVHAHPHFCVALSCLRQALPSFHYMVAAYGGNEVPCSPYRLFGSTDLAAAVAKTMGERYTACLIANHGMIAIGDTLRKAFTRTEGLETLARQYYLSRTLGEVSLLTDVEMDEVHQAYKSYRYGEPSNPSK